MKTQILISLNQRGLGDISLIAESEKECEKVMETYKKFEPEIVSFITAMRKKSEH